MKPIGAYDEMAVFLTENWWVDHGGPHHWDIEPGGTITVNIEGLTNGGQALALAALQFWADVADINFQVTAGSADITYDDEQFSAFFDYTGTAGFFTSATVNVDKNANNGVKSLDSYTFRAFVHETGHVLGLGHLGYYNGNTSYETGAYFRNDSWQVSTMSYFSQVANPTVNASGARSLTPMIADILAVQSLYGAAPDTRSGDTIYGFGSNTGVPIYDPSSFPSTDIAITIYDAGGVDTFDYSSFSDNQLIDLKAEGISNTGGLIGNLVISRNVDIENATGGSGDDFITGNTSKNLLIGNAGDDTLRGEAGDDQLFSGFGDDRAEGGGGEDLIRTGPGKDTLLGGSGDDTLGASNKSDLLRGENGRDLLLGSNGNDRLFGGSSADTLLGGNGRDTLTGDNGFDRLRGQDGDDVLEGGAGGDFLDGDAGTDTASYANAGAGVQVRLWNGDGTAGDALGDTLLEIENLAGSAHDDTLSGDAGANRIDGNAGDDVIQGLDGADQLIGDRGDDLLIGGTGDDTFLYFAGDGADTITDFAVGAGSDDVIRLFNMGPAFDTFAEVLAAASDVGGNAVIDFGGGDQITLQGVATADLHQDDFVFG